MVKRVGIGFTGAPFTVKEVTEFVKLAEINGFESAWIAEDYFLRDAVTALACLAISTRRIKIGAGVINPYSRNPVIIAETLATLDELSNGRVQLALGTGVQPLIESMGIGFGKPLTKIRESVDVIRGILSTEVFSYNGRVVRADKVTLGFNPYFELLDRFEPVRKKIPIYVAAIGPKMLELAGEIGDGVLLTAGCSPGNVKDSVERVKVGAEKACRDLRDIDVGVYIVTSMSKSGMPEAKAVRGFLSFALSYASQNFLEAAGIDESKIRSFKEVFLRKGMAEAASLVEDEIVDLFSACGEPDRCFDKIDEYIKAGATLPILLPMNTSIPFLIESMRQYL